MHNSCSWGTFRVVSKSYQYIFVFETPAGIKKQEKYLQSLFLAQFVVFLKPLFSLQLKADYFDSVAAYELGGPLSQKNKSTF